MPRGYAVRRGFTYRGGCELHSPYREVFERSLDGSKCDEGEKGQLGQDAEAGEMCVNVAGPVILYWLWL